MSVAELIEELKEYPQNMPIAIDGDPFMQIKITQRTWVDSNYPYDRPDFEYVNLE